MPNQGFDLTTKQIAECCRTMPAFKTSWESVQRRDASVAENLAYFEARRGVSSADSELLRQALLLSSTRVYGSGGVEGHAVGWKDGDSKQPFSAESGQGPQLLQSFTPKAGCAGSIPAASPSRYQARPAPASSIETRALGDEPSAALPLEDVYHSCFECGQPTYDCHCPGIVQGSSAALPSEASPADEGGGE